MPHDYLLPMKVRIIISNPWRWWWDFCIFDLQQVIACSGRKVIFYDQVQRKDLNMVLNPKIQIQNITPISESKSMSKISSSTSKSQTSYSTLRPQHSGRHRSVHSLSTSSRSWIKPQRLPFHTGHQVTQRRQSENCLNAQPLKTPTSNSFWMHPKRTDCGRCWTVQIFFWTFSHLLTLDYYPEELAALVTELDLERFWQLWKSLRMVNMILRRLTIMAIDATLIVDISSGFHVFGHSWGTIVATLYAAKQPTGLRKNTKTKKQFGHDRCRSLCSKTS